jgi:nitrogen fixation protein FixH
MSESTAVARRKDLWIPGCFILFFVCLAALEVWFMTLAHRSFTGVVTDDAYSIGLNEEELAAQREAARRLGWTAAMAFEQGPGLGGRLTLQLRDAAGQALNADEVRATAERMTRFPQIQAVRFVRQPGGEYLADFSVPLAGRWFVRVRLARGGQSLQVIDEVHVRP